MNIYDFSLVCKIFFLLVISLSATRSACFYARRFLFIFIFVHFLRRWKLLVGWLVVWMVGYFADCLISYFNLLSVLFAC